MNAGEKKWAKAITALMILCVAGVLLAHQFEVFTIKGLGRLNLGDGGGDGGDEDRDIDTSMRSNYLNGIGTFKMFVNVYDTADPNTKLTISTNYNVKMYQYQFGVWIPGPTLDSDGENFELQEEDGGYAWAACDVVASQYYYWDYAKMQSSDRYIEEYRYFDIDDDDTKEFVFKYDFKNHAVPSSGYPEITLKGFMITYDASAGISDLANATAIGTSTVTKTYEQYLTISAAKKGIAIYKIEFIATTTDETRVRLKNMLIPGVRGGDFTGDDFEKTFTSTEIRWTKTFTSSLDGADYLVRAASDNLNKFYMTTEIEFTLQTSDDILLTWNVYYMQAVTSAGKSETDSFYAQQA